MNKKKLGYTRYIEKQGTKQCRKIYSEHNAMLNIEFLSKMEAKN